MILMSKENALTVEPPDHQRHKRKPVRKPATKTTPSLLGFPIFGGGGK
jgi:hypothetical protein